MDDDHELIAAVAAGDDTALRELFARHAPWLAARLRAVLPAADVEDVLQETFLAVWQGARRYRPEGAAAAWLWGIARRQAAQWLRRRGRAADARWRPWLKSAPGRPRPGRGRRCTRAELADAVEALGLQGRRNAKSGGWSTSRTAPVAEVAELMGVPAGHGEEPGAPGPAAAAGGAGGRPDRREVPDERY